MKFFLGSADFSIVQFATTETRVTGLSSSNVVIPFLNGLNYTGGSTNQSEALLTCQQSLITSTNTDRRNVILLITDGVPERPKVDQFDEARPSVVLVKDKGTHISPVFIGGQNQEQLNYMRSLSSDGEVLQRTSFGELSTLVQGLQTPII